MSSLFLEAGGDIVVVKENGIDGFGAGDGCLLLQCFVTQSSL